MKLFFKLGSAEVKMQKFEPLDALLPFLYYIYGLCLCYLMFGRAFWEGFCGCFLEGPICWLLSV